MSTQQLNDGPKADVAYRRHDIHYAVVGSLPNSLKNDDNRPLPGGKRDGTTGILPASHQPMRREGSRQAWLRHSIQRYRKNELV